MHKYYIGPKDNSDSNKRLTEPCSFFNSLNQQALSLRAVAGNKPIWLKEFSVKLNNVNEYDSITYNEDQVKNFMYTVIKHLNKSDIFTRYAWFNTSISPIETYNDNQFPIGINVLNYVLYNWGSEKSGDITLNTIAGNNYNIPTDRSKIHYFSLLYDNNTKQSTTLGNFYRDIGDLSGVTSMVNNCCDFTEGVNNNWPYVLVATTTADGESSKEAQTFTMNITSLPEGGANYRVYKTTENGSNFFGTATALALDNNTFTVGGVSFNRAVKFQFSSGNIEFDSLSLNGVNLVCSN